jgi:hypothetical protein
MTQLNSEDIQNILNLITRVNDLKGHEATPVAILQGKLMTVQSEMQGGKKGKPTVAPAEDAAPAAPAPSREERRKKPAKKKGK